MGDRLLNLEKKNKKWLKYSRLCPVTEVDKDSGAKVFLNLEKLEREELCDKLWLCTSCFLCEEDILNKSEKPSPRRLSIEKRREQKPEDKPSLFRNFLKRILDTGYIFEMTEVQKEVRKSLGLPPLPKTGKEELKTLIKRLKESK